MTSACTIKGLEAIAGDERGSVGDIARKMRACAILARIYAMRHAQTGRFEDIDRSTTYALAGVAQYFNLSRRMGLPRFPETAEGHDALYLASVLSRYARECALRIRS